jgi:hypothetical protein
MFNIFGNKRTEPVSMIEPSKKEVVPEAMYSIGATAEGTHMTFKIGYTTLTMNKQGCQQLIEQLEVFKNQLRDDGQ